MRKFYRRNLSIKIVSILLAFLLWVYVSNLHNPTQERSYNNLPLNYKGVKQGLVVADSLDKVTVRLQGSSSVLNNMSPKDVTAFVDLEKVGVGTTVAEVRVTAPPGVQLISVQPAKVTLNLDELNGKQVPVKVKLLGKVARDFRAMEPVLKPEKVVITGPNSLLEKVDKVEVVVDLKGAGQNIQQVLPVQVRDIKGKVVTDKNIDIQPKVIEVLLPVVESLPSKTVRIKPMLKGQPAVGWRIGMVMPLPDYFTIVGRSEELAKIDFLETQTINVSGAKEELRREVVLQVPKGLQVTGANKITVVVKVEPDERVDSLIQPIQLRNLPSGNTAALEKERVEISWSGVRDPNLNVWVDLRNVKPGVNQVPVQLEHGPGMKVVKVLPETISVVVE